MKNGGKVLHLFWGIQQYLDLSRKRCPEIGKSKSDFFQEQKLKTCITMQLHRKEIRKYNLTSWYK